MAFGRGQLVFRLFERRAIPFPVARVVGACDGRPRAQSSYTSLKGNGTFRRYYRDSHTALPPPANPPPRTLPHDETVRAQVPRLPGLRFSPIDRFACRKRFGDPPRRHF